MVARLLWEFYCDIPIVTRLYTTLSFLTTFAVHLKFLTPLQLYFNPRLIVAKWQIWRLFTSFFYYGPMDANFGFALYYNYHSCRLLEDGSFQRRSADLCMMFIFGGVIMIYASRFNRLIYFAEAIGLMMLYVWGRRNNELRLDFFGLISFRVPYYAWVMVLASMIVGAAGWTEVLLILAGHTYYYLADVVPQRFNGLRLIRTPYFLRRLFDEQDEVIDLVLPEEEI